MQPQILIADDNQSWRETLRMIVEDEGYQTQMVASYEEALAALKNRFAVAILDLRLEDSDPENEQGFELASEVVRRHPDTKIIILTGYGTEQHRVKAQFNYDAYFFHKERFDQDLDLFRSLLSNLGGAQKAPPVEPGNAFDWAVADNQPKIDRIAKELGKSSAFKKINSDDLDTEIDSLFNSLEQGLQPLVESPEGEEIVESPDGDRQFIGKYWSQGLGRAILMVIRWRETGLPLPFEGVVLKVIGTPRLEGFVLLDEGKSLNDFFAANNGK